MLKRLAFTIIIMAWAMAACSPSVGNQASPTPAATDTPAPTETLRPTDTATATVTPSIPAGATEVFPGDGMVQVYIPAGSFVMGSDTGQSEAAPAHSVTLSAYWIDQTEVTNGMFAKCVEAGQCEAPYHNDAKTHRTYYGNPAYDNYPVIWINRIKANAYCTWMGRRLPTEAEWEYAARGQDGRTYPWGEAQPTCDLANFKGCTGDTVAVGSYPDGASPFGVLDMAGNVMEWVFDWNGSYPSEAVTNPYGPVSGDEYILRGGSFFFINDYLASTARLGSFGVTGYSYYDSGFRCAMSVSQ